jgi:hypothetical protein
MARLDWHIARGSLSFHLLLPRILAMSSNTNAQESLGGDIQSTALRKRLPIGEAMEHLYRYFENIEIDFKMANEGIVKLEKPSRV